MQNPWWRLVKTSRLRQNGCHIADNFFKCIFLWKLVYFDWNYTEVFSEVLIGKKLALFQIMAWCQTGKKPLSELTHWGGVTHICVSKLPIIGSDNGLLPDRRQAIIWTNDGILSIGPLGTKLSEILIAIHIFSFKKMHLKMSPGKWWPCRLGLNVLMRV